MKWEQMKKVHICKCGCGQSHPLMPPGAWMTTISGWHRVRIVGLDGPSHSSEEIGAGNDPADAVEEAWEWMYKRMDRSRNGHCWECNDKPYLAEQYKVGECPSCPVCTMKYN